MELEDSVLEVLDARSLRLGLLRPVESPGAGVEPVQPRERKSGLELALAPRRDLPAARCRCAAAPAAADYLEVGAVLIAIRSSVASGRLSLMSWRVGLNDERGTIGVAKARISGGAGGSSLGTSGFGGAGGVGAASATTFFSTGDFATVPEAFSSAATAGPCGDDASRGEGSRTDRRSGSGLVPDGPSAWQGVWVSARARARGARRATA